VNFLLVEALQRFHHYFGDAVTVECPTGSGHELTLNEVSIEISSRLSAIFLEDPSGSRPMNGHRPKSDSPHFRDHVLFYEYFHGDSGRGLGAAHQTGWTALVAKLIHREARDRVLGPE
jgi:hypothetical protein